MGPELIIALSCAWLASWSLFLRLRRGKSPGLRRFGPQAVSLIIPARNEAGRLPRLLSSLAEAGSMPGEVIVVDDGSTDDTASIAAAHGARVIRALPPPAGWKGKTWACETGAAAANGEILMFLDADAWFEIDGLDTIMAAYPGGAFSVLPWHRTSQPVESLSAVFSILMAVGTIPDGLSGPCLLVDRGSYRKVGGHESVKDKILETVALTEHFRDLGVPVASMSGKGSLAFQMYPDGFASIARGWMKGFAGGAARTPLPVMIVIVVWISGLIIAISSLASPWGWIAWAAFVIQFGMMLSRVGRFHPLAALLYPIPLAFYLLVFGAAACGLGRNLRWKGRKIHDL